MLKYDLNGCSSLGGGGITRNNVKFCWIIFSCAGLGFGGARDKQRGCLCIGFFFPVLFIYFRTTLWGVPRGHLCRSRHYHQRCTVKPCPSVLWLHIYTQWELFMLEAPPTLLYIKITQSLSRKKVRGTTPDNRNCAFNGPFVSSFLCSFGLLFVLWFNSWSCQVAAARCRVHSASAIILYRFAVGNVLVWLSMLKANKWWVIGTKTTLSHRHRFHFREVAFLWWWALLSVVLKVRKQ